MVEWAFPRVRINPLGRAPFSLRISARKLMASFQNFSVWGLGSIREGFLEEEHFSLCSGDWGPVLSFPVRADTFPSPLFPSPFQSQEEEQTPEPQDPQQRGQLREHPFAATFPAPVRAFPALLLCGTRAFPAVHPSRPHRGQLLRK